MGNESVLAGSFRARREVGLARLAGSQHGLVSAAQLRALGFTTSSVTKRVRAGRLHRVHRGVYAVGHRALSQNARWMAAVLAAGENAALSHLCAAQLWRVWRRGVNGIDVVTPERRRSRPGVRIHGSRTLDPRDVTKREGIPVTTVPRTLVDLAEVMTAERLANVIHEAAFRNVFDARATREAMERAHGRRGTPVLARAIHAHESGSAGTKSSLEDRFLKLVRRAGLPEPEINVHVPAGDQEIEVDFHWPDRRLCVEIDGPGHGRPKTQREDQARDEALHRAGHRVVRLSETDLEQGARVVRRLTG